MEIHDESGIDHFFGRDHELQQLEDAVFDKHHVLVLLTAKPGMGKSSLLRALETRLQRNRAVFMVWRFELDPSQTPEDLAGEMFHHLVKNRFLLWSPEDKRRLSKIAESIPVVGKLFKALESNSEKSQRAKLLELLEAISKNAENKIVLLVDPFDYLYENDFEVFFRTLAHKLIPKIKILIAQRPSDILATSGKLRSIGKVREMDIEPLLKRDVDEMASSLLCTNHNISEKSELLYDSFSGWPLATRLAIRAMADGKDISEISQLRELFAHLFSSVEVDSQKILLATSIVPFGILEDDLAYVCQLSSMELLKSFKDRSIRDALSFTKNEGNTTVRPFHALFRDYLFSEVQLSRSILDECSARLRERLVSTSFDEYSALAYKDVFKRDYVAFTIAGRVRLYRTAFTQPSETESLRRLFLDRIESNEQGARSYSLLSLLLFAEKSVLSVPPEELSDFVSTMLSVAKDDSFIHPEFGVLVLGSILHVSGGAKPTWIEQISELSHCSNNRLVRWVARNVHDALKFGQNPMQKVPMEDLASFK
jgi:hypothetical protein